MVPTAWARIRKVIVYSETLATLAAAMEQLKKNLKVIEPQKISSRQETVSAPAPSGPEPGVGRREKQLLRRSSDETPTPVSERRPKKISQAQLINKLNYLNFVNGTLQVNFQHPDYGETSSLAALPLPCLGSRLECRWAEGINTRIFRSHRVKSLLLTKNQQMVKIIPEVLRIDREGICVKLPDSAEEVSDRSVRRHRCEGITVQLIQNRSVFSGRLLDFNARSFKISLTLEPPQSFDLIEALKPATIIFTSEQRTLYSGECRIVRSTRGLQQRHYILAPLHEEIQRYRKTEYRSPRHQLTPSPNLIFVHPLTGSRVDLKLCDLSGSGFSVEENQADALLLPGLILPHVELSFANSLRVNCSAQVVFRRPMDGRDGRSLRCGLTLLDITPRDHVTLIGLLHQVRDENAYICNTVDLNALWDFFFETGFIYPSKYAFIEQNKQQIKNTYQRLYSQSPNIARHFIYQDKGVILGHMAMVRFYEEAWLIHHHAARRHAMNKAGLVVLDQIGRFSYDAYRLFSMHMNYLICYFRPDNKFPSRVFGGLAAHISNPRGCSLDTFAYLQIDPPKGPPQSLPFDWSLLPSTLACIEKLAEFYDRTSGGLAMRALDLEAGTWNSKSLSNEYRSHGFTRDKHHFSLFHRGRLVAFFMVTVSDIGLNLSDLTNCIKVIVLDQKAASPERIHAALNILRTRFNQLAMPVLMYPVSYVDTRSIPYSKQYVLWTLRTHGQSDKYFQYLSRLLRLA